MKSLFTSLAYLSSIIALGQTTVSVTINTVDTFSINPMIYGYNQNHSTLDADENWGSRRLGGNRMTVFNWENGASNSGADNADFPNDNRISSLVGTNWNDRNNVGEAYRKFHQDNLDAGITSIISVPIMGWVAADKNGENQTTPPSSRWLYVVPKKSSPLSLSPDLTDDSIFVDESINWLINEFGDASTSTGVKYISLDNEPGLWKHTHPNPSPNTISLKNYVSKVIETAKAIKAVDPNVKLIAGEFTGTRIINFNDASDWSTETSGYPDFPSYFLDKLKKASINEGINLVDFISFHFYPQHKVDNNNNFSGNGTVIRHSNSTDAYVRRERMDFTRSLWDTNYIEPSWLTASKLNNESHKILNRIHTAIDSYFPGVGIMIGEWDYGHDMDISHGISTVDALGAFAANQVQIANRWNTSSGNSGNFTSLSYKLFRNYDGELSTYGNVCLPTTFNAKNKASVWASKSLQNDKIHIIILNKNLSNVNQYQIKIGKEDLVVESVWGFDENSTNIKEIFHNGVVSKDSLYISLPALSAYHVIMAPNEITSFKNVVFPEIKLSRLNENKFSFTKEIAWVIFDLNGKIISKNTSTIVDINGLSAGAYIIKVGNNSWKVTKQ